MGDWGDQRVELTDELMDDLVRRRASAIAQQMAFFELDYDEEPDRRWVTVRVSSEYL